MSLDKNSELPGEASLRVPQGQTASASARQPNGDEEGRTATAEEAVRHVPSLSPQSNSKLPGEATILVPQGQVDDASARQPNGDEEGQSCAVDEANWTVPSSSPQELPSGRHPVIVQKDHRKNASAGQPFDMESTIAQIRYQHRQRNYAMDRRKGSDLALGSFLRLQLGWQPDKSAVERNQISEQAAALITLGEMEAKGKSVATDEPAYVEWRDIIIASLAARAPFDAIEKRAKNEMERLAMTLPVWAAFGENTRGFGPVSLAVIVGEAGDLSKYSSHSKLWKRMGLAVMGDVRQGGLTKSASKEDWIAHGYNRKRRSHMFVIGDVLVKVGEHYRSVYLKRKEFERAKAEAAGLKVVPAAKIPKSRASEFMSDGHVHNCARRYMEKRLLRDLWRAWRDEGLARTSVPVTATTGLLTPQPNAAEANVLVPSSEANFGLPPPQQ